MSSEDEFLEKTRDQYGGKIKKLVSYLKSQHPTTIADNTIVLPLPVNAVKMFLQYTSIKRDTLEKQYWVVYGLDRRVCFQMQ